MELKRSHSVCCVSLSFTLAPNFKSATLNCWINPLISSCFEITIYNFVFVVRFKVSVSFKGPVCQM